MTLPDDTTWEDLLDLLTAFMQDDLDVSIGRLIAYNELTGIPDWVLIVAGDNDLDMSAKAKQHLDNLTGGVNDL